jgi:hypothetical protein
LHAKRFSTKLRSFQTFPKALETSLMPPYREYGAVPRGGKTSYEATAEKKRPQEARPESPRSLRSDFAELGLGREHPINSTLRFGNYVCFGLRSRLRAVATQDRKVERFRRGSDEPDAALAFHAYGVPAIN